MKTQKIRTQLVKPPASRHIQLGGWLQGRETYLWFGVDDRCAGILHGQKLYRLAQAIVRHMESEPRKRR